MQKFLDQQSYTPFDSGVGFFYVPLLCSTALHLVLKTWRHLFGLHALDDGNDEKLLSLNVIFLNL